MDANESPVGCAEVTPCVTPNSDGISMPAAGSGVAPGVSASTFGMKPDMAELIAGMGVICGG
jgi:hypothetical protein